MTLAFIAMCLLTEDKSFYESLVSSNNEQVDEKDQYVGKSLSFTS